jgi:hypothetical protein
VNRTLGGDCLLSRFTLVFFVGFIEDRLGRLEVDNAKSSDADVRDDRVELGVWTLLESLMQASALWCS